MRSPKAVGAAVVALLLACIRIEVANAADRPCGGELTRSIPERPSGAATGTEFVAQIGAEGDDARESMVLRTLLSGNIPEFLRQLQPVHLRAQTADGGYADVTVCVLPDYLAVGSDANFFLAPMRLQTALEIANHFHFMLPTRKMVDAVYAQAKLQLQPQPLPAGDTMRSTAYYSQHNELVREQRISAADELGILTAGDKKDLVLTNRLWSNPGRVAIYGWHRPGGEPIQPLSTVHGIRYADYSHGVRLVSDTAYVGGRATPLLTLLEDRRAAIALSDEGEITNIRGLLERLRSEPTPPSHSATSARN